MSAAFKPEDATWHARVRPIKAIRAFRRAAEEPENLDVAIEVFMATAGLDDGSIAKRLADDPVGRKMLEEQPPIPDALMDPSRLAAYPEGSLGRCYADHLEREDLDPAKLVEQSRDFVKDQKMSKLHRWLHGLHSGQHDLWHVLTGYDTDYAGEGALLGFTYGQCGHRAYGIQAVISALHMFSFGHWGSLRHHFEGYRRGKRAKMLFLVDWESQLGRPLVEIRRELGLPEPPVYEHVSLAEMGMGSVEAA